MGYKLKPNKSMAKRFRVSGTGKLKRSHSLTSHLMSARNGKKKRMLGRPAILFEGHAKNMRRMMVIEGKRPNRVRAQRELLALRQAEQSAPPDAAAAEKK